MRKTLKLTALLLAAALVLSVFACQKPVNPTPVPTEVPATEEAATGVPEATPENTQPA